MRKIYLLLLTSILLLANNANSQTILISPTGDGGFETGSSFAANGWTAVNHATNIWAVGASATPYAGSNGAYISNNSGTTWAYTNTLSQTSHFYRNVTIPAGQNFIGLSFKWKGNGESGYDRLLVYTAPTSVTPVAGTPTSTSTTLTGATLVYTQTNYSQADYTTASISLPSSLSGTTFRLIFTWQNDGSAGTSPGISVDDISLSSSIIQSSSTYTINNSLPTSGTNFNTFADAFSWFNSAGVSTPTVVTVTGSTSTVEYAEANLLLGGAYVSGIPQSALLTSLSATNTLQFVAASGKVINMIGGGTGTSDYAFRLQGVDYVTFDGINIVDGGANANSQYEYGYVLGNASNSDGATNNTIKNCAITLIKTNANQANGPYGIFMQNGTTITSTLGVAGSYASRNNNNRFQNFTISGAKRGITLSGLAIPAFDTGNQISGAAFTSASGGNWAGGSRITNGGGSTSGTDWGIGVDGQKDLQIFNIQIDNFTETSASPALSGIHFGTAASTANGADNISIYNCVIRNLQNNSSISSGVNGIRATGSSLTTLKIYNNLIYDLRATAATGANVVVACNLTTSGSGSSFELYNNSIYLPGALAAAGTSKGVAFGSAASIIKVKNNIIDFGNSGGGSTGGVIALDFGSNTNSNLDFSNNIYNVGTASSVRRVAVHGSANRSSLQDWQANMSTPSDGVDQRSIQASPGFASTTDLTYGSSNVVDNSGIPVNGLSISSDILGVSRSSTTPDIGAFEGDFSTGFSDLSPPGISMFPLERTTSADIRVLITDNINSSSNLSARLWYRLSSSSGAFTALSPDVTPTNSNNGEYRWNTSIRTLPAGTYNYYIVARDAAGNSFASPTMVPASTNPGFTTSANPPNFSGANPFASAGLHTFTNAGSILAAGTYTVGSGENYATLTAVATELASKPISGNVVFELTNNYSGAGETFPIIFYQPTYTVSGPFTVTIRPSSTVTAERVTAGDAGSSNNLIILDGARDMIFDGRPGGAGTTRLWRITNTRDVASTTGGAILLRNDALRNTLRYLKLQANTNVNAAPTVGVLNIGSTYFGGQGNNLNTIDNCDISNYTSGVVTTNPSRGIYTSSTSGTNAYNSSNTYSNNLIHDFHTTATNPIGISLNGEVGATITGNSIYQTASRTGLANFGLGISVGGATGAGLTITNNYIGGTLPQCGGTPMTLSGTTTVFYGIQINVGQCTSASTVSGNTLANWNLTTSNATSSSVVACGINPATSNNQFALNITNNTIGNSTVDAITSPSILLTSSSTAAPSIFAGIFGSVSSLGNVINNNIGGIKAATSSTGTTAIVGIQLQTAGSPLNMDNNIIGSPTVANNIVQGTNSYVYGINHASSALLGNASISGNTVANVLFNAATAGTAQVFYGINATGSAPLTINSNIIKDVVGNNHGSVYGIYMNSTGIGTKITNNQIKNFTITPQTASNTIYLYGIAQSNISSTGDVTGNIISNLINNSTSTSSIIAGTYNGYGANWTYANNMISLGSGVSGNIIIYGIFDYATPPTTGGIKYYHNSVNISGSVTAGTTNTYAYLNFDGAVGLKTFNNNIFSNSRAAGTGTARGFAVAHISNTITSSNISSNYNSISGSTSDVAQWAGTASTNNLSFSAWQSTTGGDANSSNTTPVFTSANDLHLSNSAGSNWCLESAGTPISSVTTDYDGDTRSTSRPDIGADEFNATGFTITNPSAVCAPGSVDLTAAAVTDGTISGATFSYFTNVSGTTALSTPTAVASSGTYYIKATNGSCSWIKPVAVTINPQPTPSISGSNSICANSTGNVYSVTNVTGNTYSWTVTGGTITAGAGTNSITVTWGAAGTGTVEVLETITATSCTQTNSLSVTINPNPTPSITGSTAVCTTNEGYVYSVASVAGNTYAWTVTGGTVTAGAGTNSITVTWGATGTGTVAVTQTITATGCATTATASINIQELPTATSAVVEPVTCASEDGQISLTLGGAAGPYTYAWTGTGNGVAATTQNQAAVSTGFYNVTVTAANGCTTSLTNIVVSGPGGCFICPTIGSITSTNTIVCQNTNNTVSVSGLADMGITYGIRFKYSMTPLSNPYLSTAGTVMSTVTNANLTGSGTGASATYSFPTAGTVYVYAILSPTSPDPTCRPYLVKSFEVAATPALTDPTDQVLCTGSTTAAVSLVATPSATTTFAWTNSRTSIGLAASGTGNIAAFTATNYTNAPVTATVVVTPTNTESAGGTTVACVGPTQSYTYTVNPIPTVNTVADQNVCAGSAVTLPFSGFVAGTVFEWTNSNTAIGLAASGTGNLSYTPTNSTSSPITATIIVTPKFTNAGVTCTGNPISFTITVNPTPTVETVSNQVLCNGSATTAVAFAGATTGTVYNWTNSNTSIGLAASGTGDIASFTAVNTGNAAVTSTITVTPTYTAAGFTCTGTATTFTITVNPTPRLTTISNSIICNGTSNAITLTGPVTGSVYSWTNDNTAIGLGASGTGNISFTATNAGPDPITGTVSVTPSYTNAGLTCTGTTSTFTVTVNPSGQVNTVSNQVLCNGSATSAVTFSTTNNGLISTGGTQTASSGTISISVPDASAAGATHTIPVSLPTGAVISNVRVTMNMTHTWISDMVINLKAPNGQILNLFNQHGGSGDDLNNTVVSSTGTTAFASGSAPFTGTFAATAAIGQGPTGNVSNAANFAALYSTPNGNWVLAMRDLFGGDLGVLTSWSLSFDYTVQGTFGTNMNWTNSTTSIGLGASGTGNIPSFTAVNNGSAPVTSTVTVTPVYFNGGTSCSGTPTTFTYTVNPTATVNAVANQVFCAGTPSTVNFSGNATGTVYSWTNSNTAIGLAASGTGNLSFTPTNTGTTPIIATITVTPSFTNGGVTCTGTPRTFTITVNPVGQVNAVTSQVLCNGSNTTAVNFATVNGGGTIVAGTPVTANSGTIAVVVPDANAAGIGHTIPVSLPAGATVTGVSVNFNMTHTWVSDMVFNLRAPNGQILNLVNRRGGAGVNFTNTTISSTGTASLATGAAPFTGTYAADAAIGVGPTGLLSTAANFAGLYSVGSGDWTLQMRDYAGGDIGTLTSWSITINYTTLVPAVTSYAWTNNLSSIGLAASGAGNIASFTAANTTAAPVTATVTVTPTYTNAGTGCAGTPISYTYTVNPTPTVNAVSNQTVCRGSNVAAVTFTGATTGTVYNWTNSNTAIGLAASGTGNIASFVGTNTTAAPISGTITVTPVYTNAGVTCTGTPRTFTITVNPIPTVNPVANFPVCHNSVAAAAFSGATTGTVFNWTNSNPAIGLPASGSGNISFTALNTTSAPVTATITVTPSFTNGGTTCVGTPTSFVITVNPLPVVTTGTLPGRICISDTLVRLNGTPVGGSWSGFGISGFNFMPPATDVGTWPITYTYADANGCVNSASTTVTVLACEERNRDLDNGAVILYPNPNSGQFNIRVNSTRFNVLGMRVYNAAGQLMYVNQWRGLVFARVIPVNLDHLAAGTYMVRLYYGDGMDRGADKTYQVIIAH